MPYTKLSTDSKIREFQKLINEAQGTLKRTSDADLRKGLKERINALKAEMARHAQNQK